MCADLSPISLKTCSQSSLQLVQRKSLEQRNVLLLKHRTAAITAGPHLESTKTLRGSIDKPFYNNACGRDQTVYSFKTVGAVIERLCAWREIAAQQIGCLTDRQLQIMELILAGRTRKAIATLLGISRHTVERQRALVMQKTGSTSIQALARLAAAATWNNFDNHMTTR